MRILAYALLVTVAAITLSGCLVASAAGTAVGVTAKAASMTVHGVGTVVGAVVP